MSKGKLNKNLTLLLFGRMVSDIGSSVQMLIMPLFILDIGGSASTIGLFSFLYLMPILIVYPFTGVLGDRLNRKKIMVVADFTSAAIVLILTYISYIDKLNLFLLLSIQVFIAILYGFFDPATKGMIPQLVHKDDLNKTNSQVATLRIMSGLVAPILAVTLYSKFGITLLFLINGVSFLISGLSELFINYEYIKKKSISGIKGILHDMYEGASFIKNNKAIRKLSLFFLVIFAFIQPVFGVVLPLFFRTKLVYSDTQYGYIQVALFLGALLGSVLVGMYDKEKDIKRPLLLGVTLVMVTMIGYAVIVLPGIVSVLGNDSLRYLIFFSSIMFMLYFSIMFISIPVQTIIQNETPNDYMSRVFSIVGLISKGGMPLGALVYGVALDMIDIHIAVMSTSLFISVISIFFIISFNKINITENC